MLDIEQIEMLVVSELGATEFNSEVCGQTLKVTDTVTNETIDIDLHEDHIDVNDFTTAYTGEIYDGIMHGLSQAEVPVHVHTSIGTTVYEDGEEVGVYEE